MNAEASQIFDREVADNCLKLFADYQLDIRVREPGDSIVAERFLLCGIVGFTAKNLRGVLVLAATKEPLELTNPTSTTHRDWVCELANQLLGRVKNRILLRGVELYASTPVALRGEHLLPILQQNPVAEVFTADRGVVCVWLDCDFDDAFAFPENPDVIPPIEEGAMVLF